MDTKQPWQSKTIWVNFALAVVAFFPGAQDYVAAHPMLATEVIFGVNVLLRFVTQGKVQLG